MIWKQYYEKVTAQNTIGQRPKKRSCCIIVLTFFGCFLGISLSAYFNTLMESFTLLKNPILASSFGATCVLVYGSPESSLAQPLCVIVGNLVSAAIGVSLRILLESLPIYLFPTFQIIAAALSVAISTIVMQWMRVLHPPGGATALAAIIGDSSVKNLGYYYLLVPIFLGNLILILVAVLINNISDQQSYPQYWFTPNLLSDEKTHPTNDSISIISVR
jgi:CBS domain-containing membrane protein